MLMRFSSASALTTAKSGESVNDLLTLLVRLIRHPGYSRDAIVSERLKLCFPKARPFGSLSEEALRQQFAKSKIDAKTLAYLIENAVTELRMAHERTVG